MTEQKENKSGMGFAECFTRMQQCCPAASKDGKMDFGACETMMKSMMGEKDGKVNTEAMKSMMEMCCGGAKKNTATTSQG